MFVRRSMRDGSYSHMHLRDGVLGGEYYGSGVGYGYCNGGVNKDIERYHHPHYNCNLAVIYNHHTLIVLPFERFFFYNSEFKHVSCCSRLSTPWTQ